MKTVAAGVVRHDAARPVGRYVPRTVAAEPTCVQHVRRRAERECARGRDADGNVRDSLVCLAHAARSRLKGKTILTRAAPFIESFPRRCRLLKLLSAATSAAIMPFCLE